jgi:hypothetical protein
MSKEEKRKRIILNLRLAIEEMKKVNKIWDEIFKGR